MLFTCNTHRITGDYITQNNSDKTGLLLKGRLVKKLVVLSDIIVCRHRSVSLNNEKNCCEISEDKIAFCEKTAGLRRGRFLDSNSACMIESVSSRKNISVPRYA